MSDKKQLLTESEMRRFMTLANIPALGAQIVKETTMVPPGMEREGSPQESMMGEAEEEMAPEMGVGDEVGAEEAPEAGAEMGGEKEEIVSQIIDLLSQLAPGIIEKEMGGEAGDEEMGGEAGDEEMPELEMSDEEDEEAGEEEAGEEAGDEESDEEEMDESWKGEEEQELQESLVNNVLARVTARLIEEAKKKKTAAKKKMTAAEKMKALKDKKKKLDEANAAAPKSTMSNAAKAGVAKGAGKADKGTFGVTSKVADMEWKEGKTGKGGHEMSIETASSEHMATHGKKNLATMGGHKKK